jgi:hypothetical protein
MKTVSVKIKDSIFEETQKVISRLKKPMNSYINDALDYYNRYQKRLITEKRLRNESDLVYKNSLTLLEDFEGIDYADKR